MYATEHHMHGSRSLQLPEQVADKLRRFQRRVRFVKLIEGACAAIFGLCVSFLVLFALDRFIDTSQFQRGLILLVGSLGLAVWFPLVCHRWIWRSRRLEQVARILKFKHPRLGDYLLGIIELVHSDGTDGRSEALCRARAGTGRSRNSRQGLYQRRSQTRDIGAGE